MKELNFVLLIATTLLIGLGLTVYYHESAHQAVFEMNGVPSHLEFDISGGHTIPDTNTFPSMELKEASNIGNSYIEAVGYQVFPMALMICVVIFICTIYLGQKIGVKQ